MANLVTPMPMIRARFFDDNGRPLSGGKIYTYEPNTTTPKTTYKDLAATIPNTNPILLDVAGEADIYFDGLYRVVVQSWRGEQLYDKDNVGGLAQIKASFVVDASGKTQQRINDSNRIVNTIADMLAITAPQNGDRVHVKDVNALYVYDSTNTEADNGVTVASKWIMGVQDAYYASWFATKDVQVDQSAKLQTGWDYATSKGRPFIFDGVYYVAQNSRTYSDGLIRKVGLQVPSNSQAFFTETASIKLIPNAEPLGYVINFYLAENFKLWNPVVYGDVDGHLGTTDESNHCFNIVNCKNGYIHKPQAYNAWGDGFYIGVEYSSLTNKQCEDVTIFEPYSQHCGRAGISVASGKNVNIYSPVAKDIFRTAPKVGINIEGEGVGLSKPSFDNVNVLGKIRSDDCDIATSVYLFDSVINNINITLGDTYANNCKVALVTYLFASNSGSVQVGDVHATAWTQAVMRNNWSQLNCELRVGNLYSINANCSGTVERNSSVISVDIDSATQPEVPIGNFTIGDIHIRDSATTKVMHPLYFDDVSGAVYGTRYLDKGKIGNVYGTTLVSSFYVNGRASQNFKFNMEFESSFYLVPRKPYLYSKVKINAAGFDFILNMGDDYYTPLNIVKNDESTAPIKVVFPNGVAMHPTVLGTNNGIETTVAGSAITIGYKGTTTVQVANQMGTWTSY